MRRLTPRPVRADTSAARRPRAWGERAPEPQREDAAHRVGAADKIPLVGGDHQGPALVDHLARDVEVLVDERLGAVEHEQDDLGEPDGPAGGFGGGGLGAGPRTRARRRSPAVSTSFHRAPAPGPWVQDRVARDPGFGGRRASAPPRGGGSRGSNFPLFRPPGHREPERPGFRRRRLLRRGIAVRDEGSELRHPVPVLGGDGEGLAEAELVGVEGGTGERGGVALVDEDEDVGPAGPDEVRELPVEGG